MNKLRIGIIGAGRIGQLHAKNVLDLDMFSLEVITDININHLIGTELEKRVPIITTDPGNVLDNPEVDAVFICSSTDTHAEYIKKAARAGKHIFCEKPISFNLEDTREALRVVQEAGVKFQSGFNRRFDKNFRKVYENVRNGQIGSPQIIKVSSRDPEIPSEEYIKTSGGMFMDMTIHDFDMMRYLSGSEVVEVSVKAVNLVDPIFAKHKDVDTAIITLTFENGAIGVIDNSRRAVYGYDQRIEVFGDKGMVASDNIKETSIEISTREVTIMDNPKYFFLERYEEAYLEEIKYFANAILKNQPLACTGEDGFKAELLAYAANVSWKEKRSVNLSEIMCKEQKINTTMVK